MAVPATPHYGLNLPDAGTINWDTYINPNFTVIDEELHTAAGERASANESISVINVALGNKADKASGIGGTITVITAIQYDSANSKYQTKTRQFTVTDGVITEIGTESDWEDIASV